MDYKYLEYKADDKVARLTLNRPEVYNALNDQLTFELQDALKKIQDDENCRVVVLTGAGNAFSSGQDLKGIAPDPGFSFKTAIERRYNPIIRLMRGMPKPIVCRLNGVAAGAGCSLALACDIIVASEVATLSQAFVNIGLVPDSGSAFFLPRITGLAQAFELATTGRKLDAAEALSLGLINKVVPADKLDDAINEYVQYYSGAATKAIGLIKQMLYRSGTSTLEDMLTYEAYCQEIAGQTADHAEGVKAFLEKRKPAFRGV
jgi:2-(1,2-epoxy-1,2-dihydrophenyl)acetyl-CoA isomerase